MRDKFTRQCPQCRRQAAASFNNRPPKKTGLVSDWILTSCQPHRVTSGQPHHQRLCMSASEIADNLTTRGCVCLYPKLRTTSPPEAVYVCIRNCGQPHHQRLCMSVSEIADNLTTRGCVCLHPKNCGQPHHQRLCMSASETADNLTTRGCVCLHPKLRTTSPPEAVYVCIRNCGQPHHQRLCMSASEIATIHN